VPDAQGSVYINRNQTEGGTGEIHVTEVHAPNELRLNPGTTINMMSKRVVGMANGVNANDAVNVTQLGAVRTIAQNAQSAAESADAKADQALEKAESVVNNTPQQTGTIKNCKGRDYNLRPFNDRKLWKNNEFKRQTFMWHTDTFYVM